MPFVIDIDPVAFSLMGIPVRWYGLILVGAVAVADTGVVAGSYLLGLAAVRFGLFYLRDEPAVLFGLKTAQLIGLGIAGLAVVLFIAARHARGATSPFTLEASRP